MPIALAAWNNKFCCKKTLIYGNFSREKARIIWKFYKQELFRKFDFYLIGETHVFYL